MALLSRRKWTAYLGASILTIVMLLQDDGPRMLSGRVRAADGVQAVPCDIEINSASEPFYSPILIQSATGAGFEWIAQGDAPLENVYVEAKCKGYEVAIVSGLSIRHRGETRVGDVTVVKEVKALQ